MSNTNSAFDRVKNHLMGNDRAVRPVSDLGDDVEMLVRRCGEVRGLGREYGDVELSPYMKSLLRVTHSMQNSRVVVGAAAAASV
jgi:hypothetical protein